MAGRDGELVLNLRRTNLNTPWGFRLQGGKDHGTYLSVQRVFNGSPSDGQLQRGDIIVAVNNEDVTEWHQNEAQNLIQSVGLTLALVVTRGGCVPYAEARQPSGQAQSVPSFAWKPFGQQQQQQQHQQQQHQQSAPHPSPQHHPQSLSPQMTSKATLQFNQSPYTHSQPSNDLENTRPSSGITWTPQPPKVPTSSFSAPLQVRIGQPPASPYSYSPKQGDSLSHEQGSRAYQPSPGQANRQQEFIGGGRTSSGRNGHQWEAVQPTQQPNYNSESNHVTRDRDQSLEGVGRDGRNEQHFYEGGGGGGGRGGGGEEEEEDYQQMSVGDIKQMFNKPDKKGYSRVKQTQKTWMKPSGEGSISPCGYLAPGPMPSQPSSLSPRKPTTGSIQRGPPPSDDDYRKPFSPQPQSPYGQPRYESPLMGYGANQQKSTAPVNKQGGAYAGIIQPALPAKTPPSKSGPKGAQKKKDFDPNQSAVYKILLEEEERKKNQPNQRDEDEETPRRPAQGPARQDQTPRQPPKPAQGPRLTDLLERDAAQIAPYKGKPKSAYEEQVTQHHEEQRTSYQEPRPSSYHQEPRQQLHRGPPPPSHGGVPVARQSQPSHYGGPDYPPVAFPQTQYVDGIPTSDF